MGANIVYNVSTGQGESDFNLPEDSSSASFTFQFTGFTAEEYSSGRKPYVFQATLTQGKKNDLFEQNILIEKSRDDKKINFNWQGIIWHFDLTEWEKFVMGENWERGRIYFVKANDDEDLITQDNFNQKTTSIANIPLIEGKTSSQIVNESIQTLSEAWELINSLN